MEPPGGADVASGDAVAPTDPDAGEIELDSDPVGEPGTDAAGGQEPAPAATTPKKPKGPAKKKKKKKKKKPLDLDSPLPPG